MKRTATLQQIAEQRALDLAAQAATGDERRRRRALREMQALARVLGVDQGTEAQPTKERMMAGPCPAERKKL